MTTDHDPRELRAIAEDHQAWCRESHHDVPLWVDYVLATVRDDDGEEQPPTIVGRSDRLVLEMQAGKSGRRIRLTGDLVPDATITFNIAGPYTRGQFRDLCRGLGIVPDAAKTV